MWRSENWKKNPCDDCGRRVEDEWGSVCNLSCGEATAYSNYEAGAEAMLKEVLLYISKVTKRMDGTVYLVPDYAKYRKLVEEIDAPG